MTASSFRITDDLVDAVRDAVDVVDIAREHTQLRRAGRRYQGLCPLHQEKTPSFSVDPEQGLFYCFGCGRGGDAIRLHMLLSGDDFPAAIERLAMRYGIPMPAATPAQQKAQSQGRRIEAALSKALEVFRSGLANAPAIRDYLAKRQIEDELIQRYELGFAPDSWDHLVVELRGTVAEKDLLQSGLIARSSKSGKLYDRFRNRLIFPIHNAAGRLVGFGGRTMDPNEQAKYVNTSETPAFRKRNLLYGLNHAKRSIREHQTAVLVEGYFDVLGSVAAGVDHVVAGMGTSLTEEQAKLAARHAEEVILAYDGDDAGKQAGRKALPVLLNQGLAVRTVGLEQGDPDSFRLDHGDQAWQHRVANADDAVWTEIAVLAPEGTAWDPPAQAQAAKKIEALLANIPDSVAQQGYRRRAEGRLGLPPGVLGSSTNSSRQSSSPTPQTDATPVPDTELKVLHWLLCSGEAPALEDLPDEESFHHPEARNIYAEYLRSYKETGSSPGFERVRRGLPMEGETLDLLARTVVERSAACSKEDALAALSLIESRWLRTRRLVLQDAIHRAQEENNSTELERLLAERDRLMSSLHRKRSS